MKFKMINLRVKKRGSEKRFKGALDKFGTWIMVKKEFKTYQHSKIRMFGFRHSL